MAKEIFIEGLPDEPLRVGQMIELEALAWVSDDGWDSVVEIPNPQWRSSEPAVASVDQRGQLFAHTQGRARISVTHLRLRAEDAVRVVPVTAYDLSGQVVNHNDKPVADVVIVVLGGPAAGEEAITDYEGRYVLHGLTGNTTVAARKLGFQEKHQVASERAATLDFTLVGLGPRNSFGGRRDTPERPFQWIVGDEIVPGRYFGEPEPYCSWERRSGYDWWRATGAHSAALTLPALSVPPAPPPVPPPPPPDPGQIGWRIWARPAGQEIVDIHESDLLFRSSCGEWGPERVLWAPLAAIGPGTWLVGSQITPGTYRAESTRRYSQCRWARLGSFGGTPEEVLEQSEYPVVERQTVIIRESDAGFTSSGCGSWTRVVAGASP